MNWNELLQTMNALAAISILLIGSLRLKSYLKGLYRNA